MATGLGSVNGTNLVNNWAALTAATQPTVVTLTASSLSTSSVNRLPFRDRLRRFQDLAHRPESVAIEGMISGPQ